MVLCNCIQNLVLFLEDRQLVDRMRNSFLELNVRGLFVDIPSDLFGLFENFLNSFGVGVYVCKLLGPSRVGLLLFDLGPSFFLFLLGLFPFEGLVLLELALENGLKLLSTIDGVRARAGV